MSLNSDVTTTMNTCNTGIHDKTVFNRGKTLAQTGEGLATLLTTLEIFRGETAIEVDGFEPALVEEVMLPVLGVNHKSMVSVGLSFPGCVAALVLKSCKTSEFSRISEPLFLFVRMVGLSRLGSESCPDRSFLNDGLEHV